MSSSEELRSSGVAPRLVQEAHQSEVTAWAAIRPSCTRSADAVRSPRSSSLASSRFMPPTDGFDGVAFVRCRGRVRLVAVDGDQRIKTVADRRRQARGHALRQQRPRLVSDGPYGAAQHRIDRRENVRASRSQERTAPAARLCDRAVAPRPRGTARVVHRRPQRTYAGAGTRRCATDVRRPFGGRCCRPA